MNYYEQLGVASNADAEEIRRAHRRLTKVYHPDGHADNEAKQRAELQMRRINAIVGILSDPQRRLRYDEQLQAGTAPTDPTAARVLPAGHSRFYSWRWWIVSVATAVTLTVAVIWLWINDWGGLFKNRHPILIAPENAEKAAAPQEQPTISTTIAVVPQAGGKEKDKPRSHQNSKASQ